MDYRDIRQWTEQNASGLMLEASFSPDDLDHIAMCLDHISRWYHEGYPLGDFLTAVVRNDFCEACYHADDVNRKALFLYAIFLANNIPSDYSKKANKEGVTNDRARD